jgi:hypothetical protein
LNIININTNFKQKIIVFEYFRKKKRFIKCGNSLCGSVGTKELFMRPCFDCGTYYCTTCTFYDNVKGKGSSHDISSIKKYCICEENYIFLKFHKCKKCKFSDYCKICYRCFCNKNEECTKGGHECFGDSWVV